MSLKTCLPSELVALIPFAFTQVRDHVTVESPYSKCKVSLKTYIPWGRLVLVPYALAYLYDHVPLRVNPLLLMAEVPHCILYSEHSYRLIFDPIGTLQRS